MKEILGLPNAIVTAFEYKNIITASFFLEKWKLAQAFMIVPCLSFIDVLFWLVLGMFLRKLKVIVIFLCLNLWMAGINNFFWGLYMREFLRFCCSSSSTRVLSFRQFCFTGLVTFTKTQHTTVKPVYNGHAI